MPLRSFATAFLAFSLFLTVPAMAAFEQLGELEKVGARVTAIAIDLGDLSVVAERNADKHWIKAAGYWQRGTMGAHERIDD